MKLYCFVSYMQSNHISNPKHCFVLLYVQLLYRPFNKLLASKNKKKQSGGYKDSQEFDSFDDE